MGVTTGIALGAIAAVLITLASADVRSSVIVGAGLRAAPPRYDGIVTARIVAQDMNPTLVYADTDVAPLFTPTPVELKPELVVKTAVEQDLEENAKLIFAVLGALTLASWGLIMLGLTSHPAVANTGVE